MRLDKTTTKELDAMLAGMTEEQQQALTREGNKLLRGDKQAEYMRNYRARRALAARLGLTADKAAATR
jgi:hypothetical protein